MILRPMTLADTHKVYEIECESFSVPWSLESLKEEMNNTLAYYVVAEINREVVGYGGIWGVLGEGEITNIAVDRCFRGKGIGEEILNELLRYASSQSLSLITLEVRCSNEPAKRLYLKKGFEQIAIRKNYYQKPTEDALIMQYHRQ